MHRDQQPRSFAQTYFEKNGRGAEDAKENLDCNLAVGKTGESIPFRSIKRIWGKKRWPAEKNYHRDLCWSCEGMLSGTEGREICLSVTDALEDSGIGVGRAVNAQVHEGAAEVC